MRSTQLQARSKSNNAGDLLAMLSRENDEVQSIFRSVIKLYLGGHDDENPRDRQARIARLVTDCVDKQAKSGRSL